MRVAALFLIALHRATAVSSSRIVAHQVLLRCFKDGAFADRVLSSALDKAQLDGGDRGLTTELVYGVLRHKSSLDYSLAQLATLSDRTSLPTHVALRIGAYEILHLRTPDHAAVDEAVSLVQPKAQRRFINGVLRNMARRRNTLGPPTDDTLDALAIRTSTPEWLLREMQALLPSFAEVAAWAVASQQRPRLALRINRLQSDRESLGSLLQAAGVQLSDQVPLDDALLIESGAGDVAQLPGFADGLFTVQDIGAQCVALLAAPSAGSVVLDLCAAPGGKTTHLAELMDDDGMILSVELHERKSHLVGQACERLHLSSVIVTATDASDCNALHALLATHAATDSAGGALADCVIIDAPCSGMGTLRRNPEHRYRQDASRLDSLCALQDRLLDAGASCVRPGGTLTFSVCSPLAKETTERIAAFLQRHRGLFEHVKIDNPLLEPFASACDSGGERSCIRTWTHLHEADSHFACKLRRVDML